MYRLGILFIVLCAVANAAAAQTPVTGVVPYATTAAPGTVMPDPAYFTVAPNGKMSPIGSGGSTSSAGTYPWNVKTALNGCAAAIGDGVADDTIAVQCKIDWLYSNNGKAGTLFFPQGTYLVPNGVTNRGGVHLVGESRRFAALVTNRDSTVLTIDPATCAYPSVRDLGIHGYAGANPTQNTVYVPANCHSVFRDNTIQDGAIGFRADDVNGLFENNIINGKVAAVATAGANSWISNYFDTGDPSQRFAALIIGAYQGGFPVNHFSGFSDFSGNYQYSVYVDDHGYGTALTTFEGAVFSSPVAIVSSRWTGITNSQVQSTVQIDAGALTVTNSYQLAAPITVGGAGVKFCSGNVGISC